MGFKMRAADRIVDALLRSAAGELPTVFEVDVTEFSPGDKQYEVELEVDATKAELYRVAVEAIFGEAQLVPVPHPSKAKRFFDSVRRPPDRETRR